MRASTAVRALACVALLLLVGLSTLSTVAGGSTTVGQARPGQFLPGVGSFERKDVILPSPPTVGNPAAGGTCTLCAPSTPSSTAWVAYDATDASFWVASPPSSVDVVSGRALTLTATLPVGRSPFGVAVDNRTGNVYVSNFGSSNITEISPTTLRSIANITVQAQPRGLAVDSSDGTLYVADSATNNVTVVSISSQRVLTNISVGGQPIGVAWDPSSDQIFVANHVSNSVSAISGKTATVRATVSVGAGPYGLAIDNRTSEVYIADQGSNSVSVISTVSDAIVANIPVEMGIDIILEGVVYDSAHRVVWVAGGARFAVVISPALKEVVDYVFVDPSGAAFDPVTRTVCLTNSANETFACFDFGASSSSYAFDVAGTVTFTETGLPAGTNWSIILGGRPSTQATGTSDGTRIVFGVFQGIAPFYGFNYSYRVGAVSGFTATPSAGFASSGGSSVIRIVFS